MSETLAWNFVGDDQLSKLLETLDRVAGKLDRTFNSLGDQATQAGRKLGAAGAEAKGAGEEIKGTGEDAAKAGRKIDQLGDDMDKAALKAAVFDAQMRLAKRSVRELTDEFVKTGDVDVLKKLGDRQGHLAEIEKLKKDLTKSLGDAGDEGGRGFMSKLGTALSGGLPEIGGLSSMMTTGLAAGAIVAAPAIGAAINAGVLLGVGGGALAGGILLAARDARVKDAWSEFGRGAIDQLNSAAGVFVQPLVRAAQTVGAAFDSIMPSIRRDFAALAPLVDRLASGVAGLVTNAMPGISRALQASGPIVSQLAAELPRLGSAMSSFLASIARGGPGAVAFFHDLMTTIDLTLVHLGLLTEGLSKLYAVGHDRIGQLLSPLGMLSNMLDDSGKKGKDAGAGLDSLGTSADGVVAPIDAASTAVAALKGSFRDAIREAEFFNGTLDKVNGGNISLATAQIGAERAVRDFKTALEESNGSLDITTEKGAAAREAAIRLAQAAGEVAQKTYEQSGSSSQGAVALDGYRQALYNTARQSGLTEAAAHALVDQYLKVPPAVSTTVTAPGLAQTRSDAAEAYRGLDRLDGKVVNTYAYNHIVTYYEDGRTQAGNSRYGRNDFAGGGRVGKRAMGGWGGGSYDVGENGPERVVLPDDAYVIPNNQMSRGSGPEVLDAVDVPLRLRDSVTGDVVVNALLRLSKQRGRTVAQLLQIA